jgi:hypothetical protein
MPSLIARPRRTRSRRTHRTVRSEVGFWGLDRVRAQLNPSGLQGLQESLWPGPNHLGRGSTHHLTNLRVVDAGSVY